eukprot:6639752-Alexandrium_andersonii.AAC.1
MTNSSCRATPSASSSRSGAPVSTEVGALEPEPPEGDVDPQQLQAAFELLRRAAYRPGKASGKGGKPGAPG